MPRQRNARPSYLYHQPSGQARVRIAGRDHYLGEYCSSESFRKFKALVAKVAAGDVASAVDADRLELSR